MANYQTKLNLLETEIAIKFIKDNFERDFSEALNLIRVSAPLMVVPESGLNDNLNGFERPVHFDVLYLKKNVEIVQSLAKWKRMALAKYGFKTGCGLYTDMNAIRRDEELDHLHSICRSMGLGKNNYARGTQLRLFKKDGSNNLQCNKTFELQSC